MTIKRIVCIALFTVVLFGTFIDGVVAADISNADAIAISKADESISKKDYINAANILQEYLKQYPDTKNELIYKKLGDLYDHYTFDFDRAATIYRSYLSAFPTGQYKGICENSLNLLEENRLDWDALKQYRTIMADIDSRSFNENVEQINNLIKKYQNALVASDAYYWLAQEYFKRTEYKLASTYCDKYLETFPENGKTDSEKSLALMLYSQILQERHQYNKAISALDEVMKMGNPNQYLNYDIRVSSIKTHYKLWIAFVIAIIYILMVILLVFIIRPWKTKGFKISINQFIIQFIIIVLATIGPMLMANHLHHGLLSVFPFLLVSGMAELLIIDLLSPIAGCFNKALYYSICLVLIIAGSFTVIYFTKSSSILWTFL